MFLKCGHAEVHGVARIKCTDVTYHAYVCAHANARFSATYGGLRLKLGMPECQGICFDRSIAICQLHHVGDVVADAPVRQVCVLAVPTLRHSF